MGEKSLRLGWFDLSRVGCYNRHMEETRNEIIKRIETKKGSASKLAGKASNLKSQRETYLTAIAEHEAKIEKLRGLIARIDENTGGYEDDSSLRSSEVEHMEEILARFDKAVAERESNIAKVLEVIDSHEDWAPGKDVSLKGAYERDPRYKKLKTRNDYLDQVIESALPDVKKIFYSRGVVSDIHEKGRKGV